MIVPDKLNPFNILGIPTNATYNDIVERGQELCECAETQEDKLLFRWAMEELIKHPDVRLEYELFEVPAAKYENRDWEKFIKNHERSPVNLREMIKNTPPPRPEDFDLAKLCLLILDSMLKAEKPKITPTIENSPFKPDIGSPPLEIKNVVFG